MSSFEFVVVVEAVVVVVYSECCNEEIELSAHVPQIQVFKTLLFSLEEADRGKPWRTGSAGLQQNVVTHLIWEKQSRTNSRRMSPQTLLRTQQRLSELGRVAPAGRGLGSMFLSELAATIRGE